MQAMKSNETQDVEVCELTGKQAACISALVSGATIESAAKAQKTNASTVHAWMKKPEFRAAYQAALSDVISHASGQLKAACSVAVATLREVCADCGAPSAPRVSAARAILELASKQIEQEEVIARIEVLEEKANPTP